MLAKNTADTALRRLDPAADMINAGATAGGAQ